MVDESLDPETLRPHSAGMGARERGTVELDDSSCIVGVDSNSFILAVNQPQRAPTLLMFTDRDLAERQISGATQMADIEPATFWDCG